MIKPLVKFRGQLVSNEREALDASRILTSAIRGFVETQTIPISSAPIKTGKSGLPSTLTLISRLSCRRAGTRFNSRGIDDDGNVANFVESETIYWSPSGLCFSYVQVRGSVPVFWEQATNLVPGQQKITITRSKEGTQPAFDKHFKELEQAYGAVHIVNLLSATKPGEFDLTERYRNGIQHSALNKVSGDDRQDLQMLRETEFDFHAETKQTGYDAASKVRHLIEQSADGFAYYLSEEVDETANSSEEKTLRRSVVILQQEGVFRTNCLDCLDRTNLVQGIISSMALEAFLGHRGEQARADFWMRHSTLWADNGDSLSKIYAGTGALKSSFTRSGKMSFAGAVADFRKSAQRVLINNFVDPHRQNTMDILLGRLTGQVPVHLYDPINEYVNNEMSKRAGEYSTSKNINIFVGTFNLNGRTNGVDEDLSSWLCPEDDPNMQPHLVVVGFQEIVELSPQQIMNSDPMRKQVWEKAVKRCLNEHAEKVGGDKYVLLRSGQLVGAALCIFVKASSLHDIKNVEGNVKKTGMSGMAGNKGAVAIRMDYANTSLCFVTAHLAAGFANYDERNKDYHTIHHGLRFQRNRGIDDHETVIWLGDFNYRIGMGAEKVRGFIHRQDLETLYENDQLNIQMVAGLTFPHYSEAKITFMPTYKFDLGSDTYDSSEKARIPAWTDRILRKGTNIRQLAYNCAPLRFSDHRPVYAAFQCAVSIVDETAKEALGRKLFEKRRAEVGGTVANSRSDDTDDEDLIGYDAIEPGLPPASSDRKKWWLESGQPARSTVKPPSRSSIVNPKRPANPWAVTDEPDWVNISRQPGTARSDSSQSIKSGTSITPDSGRAAVNNRVIAGSRKLPPRFNAPDPSTVYSLPTTPLPDTEATPPPQPPRARQNSTSSSISANSSLTRKQPPRVVKKPSHLTGTSTGLSSPVSLRTTKDSATTSSPDIASMKPQTPIRTNTNPTTMGSNGIQHSFLPPPRRATGDSERKPVGSTNGRPTSNHAPVPPPSRRLRPGTSQIRNLPPAYVAVAAKATEDAEEKGPGLPPRPTGKMDLLGGDADEMNGWEALKPSS